MFLKLVKHELRESFRLLLPVFGGLLLMAGLARGSIALLEGVNDAAMRVVGVTFVVFFFLGCGAAVVLTAVFLIQRFTRSVYGDEGQRFYGSSSNGAFVYGREVSILLSKGSKSQTVSGRVVSSPEVNPGGYPGNVILIELQDPGELLGTGGEAKVSYTLLTEVFTGPPAP